MANIFYPMLMAIGALENYKDLSQKGLNENDLEKICSGAKSLLELLGEDKVEDWELRKNSVELKEFIYALKTIRDEYFQEQRDDEVIKLAYRTSLKHSPKVLKELVCFYSSFGPEQDKDKD